MDPTVVSYIVYLPASVAVTVWVARVLSRNGRVFLADVFRGDDLLADSVNQLLVVGFYLVNLGFIGLWMKTGDNLHQVRGVFESVSVKLGTVLLVVGVLHMANVFVLNALRRRGLAEQHGGHSAASAWKAGAPGPQAGH
ncbi:hypothetical protein [Streptantibioticus silvisoli]|uniref:Integral membrane protein n=1 Tax=Streptantibioticus silvisoli TaxID=2705255 RepID=A0ABT6WAK1_9ACTN|nr:hypothetical protein [Streptantibioticus silvisoli]MDI5967473.1 hypothetical protein [Streptantibioticus silvisoli]